MKKLKVQNFGNTQPYPMYFTMKGNDGEQFQEQAKYHSQPIVREKKKVMDNFIAGTSSVTAAHNDTLQVGDSIVINEVEHTIEQVIESRPAKGNHHQNVTWYNLACSYVRFTGQTV